MDSKDHQLPASCEVAIIGAGAGGLMAAGLLAKAGLQVVVLEAASQPGGYLAGFQRQGFHFNTSVGWLSQCGPGGFVHRLLGYLGKDFPACPPLTRIHRYKNDHTDYLLSADPMELEATLLRDFPGDARGIRAFFRDSRKLAPRLQALNNCVCSPENMTLAEKVLHGLRMLGWALPLIRHIRTPVEKGISRYFGPAASQIYCSQESMMSVIVPVAWAFAGNYQACPRGGSQALVIWLCERIQAAGSRVVLNQRVERVLLDARGEAAGVALADGRTLAARYVIAACDVQLLYNQLLPPGCIPSRLRAAITGAEAYHACFSIFLGLDCPAAALGIGEEVVNLTRSGLTRAEHSSGDPHRTIITIMSPAGRDASLAPAGKGSLMIQCPASMAYEQQWRAGSDLTRGAPYRALKQEFAGILLDRIEATLAPTLRQHIEVMEIATPVTYWRYTGNTGGRMSGAKPTGRNILARVAHYRTPVKRLLLGGQGAEYGGGVPMAMKAGANASLLVMKELRPTAFAQLKALLRGADVSQGGG